MRWYLEAASKEMWSVRTLDRSKPSSYKNNKKALLHSLQKERMEKRFV